MSTINLLYKHEYAINDSITIRIPTVGEILDDEDNYYQLVSMLTAMPIDLMVQLDDAGIDFTTINDYDLFLMTAPGLKDTDTHLVFGDLDFSNFELEVNTHNNTVVFRDPNTGIVFDRSIHHMIAELLRKIHHLKVNIRKPANKEAREYMIERARIKMRRAKRKKTDSGLEQLIIAIVNTAEFPYNYEETRDMTIYQFNASLHQIVSKVDYDNLMHGVYAGTIDSTKINQKEFNWLTHD